MVIRNFWHRYKWQVIFFGKLDWKSKDRPDSCNIKKIGKRGRYGGLCALEQGEKNIPKNFTMLFYEPMKYSGRLLVAAYITIGHETYSWKQSLEKELIEEFPDGMGVVNQC